ncbi:MAG: PilZ domain-containing protein [Thermodesulfobacteriota bacterium]|nr:PilZ domain-containing protein [Thermodesulfobacteriota bacterium]
MNYWKYILGKHEGQLKAGSRVKKSIAQQEKTMGLNHLEKRDWELWCMAVLMILVLTLFVLISYIWELSSEDGFSEENMKLLSIFGNYLSLAMDNANLTEEVQRKIKWGKKHGEYFENIIDLLQDLSSEGKKDIEKRAKYLLRQQKKPEETGNKAASVSLKSEVSIELRGKERVDEIILVEFKNNFPAETVNINEGGIFIRTSNPLDLEEQFPLKIHLPDSQEPLEVECKVVWINQYGKESDDLPRGMGVKFLKIKPEFKKRIEEFIALKKNGFVSPPAGDLAGG